jgi:broad specificity phosphatase PhoE
VSAFRHANTTKAAPGSGYQGDLDRVLTQEGEMQARIRRKLIGEPTFNRIGSSFTTRAKQTAMIIGGVDNESDLTILNGIGVTDPELGGDSKSIDDLFNGLGYAALDAYRVNPEDSGVMDRYGETGWNDLKKFIWQNDREERLLLVGHAVLLPQAFLPSLTKRPDMAAELLSLNLNEVGGFRIIYKDDEPLDFMVFNDRLP